jgi:hypothetical protein
MKFDADARQHTTGATRRNVATPARASSDSTAAIPVTTKTYQPKYLREKLDRWMIINNECEMQRFSSVRSSFTTSSSSSLAF